MKKSFLKEKFFCLLKFSAVGVLGVGVNYVFLFLFYELFHFYYLVSAAIAIEISIISNFILNDIWTFKQKKEGSSFFVRLLKFNLVCLGGLLINLLILKYLKEELFLNLYFAEFFGILGGFLWNFLFSNFFVWKK